MLKRPASVPPFDPSRADIRLPEAALKFRIENRIINIENLRRLNITAWLYRDQKGNEQIQVNPNTTIAELIAQFGPADTRDAETGIHSEARAAEFFRRNPDLKVLQIFTERIPCFEKCAPLLGNYFSGIPVFYYYDKRSWGETVSAGDLLAGIYGSEGINRTVDPRAQSLSAIQKELILLKNATWLQKSEHKKQLDLVRNSWNPMGRAVQLLNPVKTPELDIWDDTEWTINAVRDLLSAKDGLKAAASLFVGGMQHKLAVRRFAQWKDGFDRGVHRTYWAIGVVSAAAIITAGIAYAVAASAPVAAAAGTAVEGTDVGARSVDVLKKLRVLDESFDLALRDAASSDLRLEDMIDNGEIQVNSLPPMRAQP